MAIPLNPHAAGLMISHRSLFIHKTLESLQESDLASQGCDLFLILHGTPGLLKTEILDHWIDALPVKNVLVLPPMKLSVVWNIFLALTKYYNFRTLIDDDLVWPHSGVSEQKSTKTHLHDSIVYPFHQQTSFQSIPSSVVMGASEVVPARAMVTHARFLETATNVLKSKGWELCSLLPVPVWSTFQEQRRILREHHGVRVIPGGCVTFTRAAFDQLGFFDERLPRKLWFDYSLRAARQGLKWGVQDQSFVYHLGEGQPADGQEMMRNAQVGLYVLDNRPEEARYRTKWSSIFKFVRREANRSLIVEIE